MLRLIVFIVLFSFCNLLFSQSNGGILRGDKEINFGLSKKLDKMKQEYDESNLNYAISFLDNSGLFEADEKGNALTAMMLNNSQVGKQGSSLDENQAYNHLKQGEALMAANKHYLAEESFLAAKRLYEKRTAADTANYAQTLSNLSLLYQNRGLYSKAQPIVDSAITIRSYLSNKNMLAVSYNNKGILLKDQGKYLEAEELLKKAITILKDKNNELGLALTKNNLAMVYADMNKMKEAEGLMSECMTHAEKVLKTSSSNYIKLEINLANIYKIQKKYLDADFIYKRAIKKKETLVGTSSDLAHLKSGLAQVYMEMGNYREVEKLLESAYDINKRKLGESNPATIKVMQEQANYYRLVGNNDKALVLIGKVLNYKKGIYGENHPSYIQALEDMALIYWNKGSISDAKEAYTKVLDDTRNYIATYFNTLNENEKNVYWDKTRNRIQRFYSFAYSNYNSHPDLIHQMMNTIIATKGFLLNGSSKLRNTIMQSDDAELKNIYKKWLYTKENLNSAYQLSKEELEQEKINVDSLQKKADEYERQLSKKSSLFSDNKNTATSYDTIQKLLGPNDVAVEIVQVNEFKNSFTGNSNYVALVINNKNIAIKIIGSSEIVDTAIVNFRAKIIDQQTPPDIYAIVWQSVDSAIAGKNKVYLSLDGAFHQLSINAIKDAGGKYILDKYSLQFVGNLKDVASVKRNESKSTKPKSAFLVGNPFYGTNELIPQLPGTESEVKYISSTLKSLNLSVTSLYGKEATETKIKAVKSPNILHIATHGYFLADVSQMETNKVLGVDISAAKENPLLRSGLLFANCDNVFDENYKPVGADNGVLTAYEAMTLNLDKTDLVVLSACETGLGSVKQGEGVYGLQRAFLIAGAKSIIMSLWSVSDDATMELMKLFYGTYAKTGNKFQAFTEAQKSLKVKYKDPFYWSAFVMLNI